MKVRYNALKKPKSDVDSDGSLCRDILGGLDLVFLIFSGSIWIYPGFAVVYRFVLSCHSPEKLLENIRDTFVQQRRRSEYAGVPLVCPIAVVWCVRMNYTYCFYLGETLTLVLAVAPL